MLTLTVNDQHTFEVQSDPQGIRVNDEPFAWDLLQTGPSSFHILHQARSYRVDVLEADYAQKAFTLRINNRTYRVKGKNALDILLERMGMNGANASRVQQLKAPMPGLILDIKIQAGDSVKKGDPIMILEAMKMENIIKSPGDGLIKAVRVKKGQNVEKNQLLVEFG